MNRQWLGALVCALAVGGCTSSVEHAGRAATPKPSASVQGSTPTSDSTQPSAPTRSPTHSPAIPALSAKARAAGLVDVRTVVPDALVDLRYATADNFTHTRLYPVSARCLVHRSMVAGLRTAAARLRAAGYLLVFWDCYRPHSVQVRMFRIVPNPDWVARPGPYAYSHESGRSVDVTLAARGRASHCAAAAVAGHCLLDMGTGFDDFTPRAYAYATDGVSARARADRATLRSGMAAGGLQVYAGEWWHFDGPGAGVHRPLLDAPLS